MSPLQRIPQWNHARVIVYSTELVDLNAMALPVSISLSIPHSTVRTVVNQFQATEALMTLIAESRLEKLEQA